MEVIRSINDIKTLPESCVTIGNFDGVHNGHRILIKKTTDYAKEKGIKSVVFTFANHPSNYFVPGIIKNILDENEKIELIESCGADYLLNIPFETYMTKMSSQSFVEDILIEKINVKKVIVGHDFTFARKKEGTAEVLVEMGQKYGFEVEIVQPIKVNDIRISSTHIRKLISEGKMDEVPLFLGRNYSIKGEVIHGMANGRKIGFPTANIKVNKELVMPGCGIYASIVKINDKNYYGATNVGFNPTVNGKGLSIETHILDFEESIYGKIIEIEFLERIRDEKKFCSMDELREQLSHDVGYIREKYSKYKLQKV